MSLLSEQTRAYDEDEVQTILRGDMAPISGFIMTRQVFEGYQAAAEGHRACLERINPQPDNSILSYAGVGVVFLTVGILAGQSLK